MDIRLRWGLPLRHRHAVMQVEYPFSTYNLFAYVMYCLYDAAKKDPRFVDALNTLKASWRTAKLRPAGQPELEG